MVTSSDKSPSINFARTVIEIELAAVHQLLSRLDREFERACEMLLSCEGRVVVIGMGKSGHIGGKTAATLASTGTPAFFVHPGEASHGDMGMITPKDVVVIISNSGEVSETISILPIVKNLGVSLIAMTGKKSSTLAQYANVCLDTAVDKEACPLNLAPTASTTATLVMGDALAIAVQRMRGFSVSDFARTHPGGALGKRLLLTAENLMHTGDEIPLVDASSSMDKLLLEMSLKSLGMVGVTNARGHLVGIFTDGDLRRALANEVDIYNIRVSELITSDPFTIAPNTLAEEIVSMMREHAQKGLHAINGLFVVDDENQVLGALNTYDLLRAGII